MPTLRPFPFVMAQQLVLRKRFQYTCQGGDFPPSLMGLKKRFDSKKLTGAHRYPPFYGYELRPGVTFTHLGFRVGH